MIKAKIVAVSMHRYNGGVKAKRLYGSSTMTEFDVYLQSEEGDMIGKRETITVGGATPGERKTAAINKFKALRGIDQ